MVDFYAKEENLFAYDNAMLAGKKAASGRPLMVLQCGFASADPALNGFSPTAREVEYCAFASLRLKANAIGFYQCGNYRMESYSNTWTQAKRIYAELAALSFIPYGEELPHNAIRVQDASKSICFRAVRFDGRIYIIAQNHSFKPVQATFLPAKRCNSKVQVLFENRQLTPGKNGGFIDGFQETATHIYCIR